MLQNRLIHKEHIRKLIASCPGGEIDDETTSATVEDEITKLLGLTHEPLDYVNPDGEFSLSCFKPLSPFYFLYTWPFELLPSLVPKCFVSFFMIYCTKT